MFEKISSQRHIMSYPVQEKIGIIDLLKTERNNVGILFQLAKSVTKNITQIETEQGKYNSHNILKILKAISPYENLFFTEALECIFLHIPDSQTLLNKRMVTKEILFKYLHQKKVPITADFTKATLIKKIIDYWYENYARQQTNSNSSGTTNPKDEHKTSVHVNSTTTVAEEPITFPIHLLARKFSEWFFDNYNKDSIKLNDFWSDACLLLEIVANDRVEELICENSTTLLQTILETRQRFDFFFNPNLSLNGVQGRMDIHGLVLVLACGTLHTKQDCVGVFECVFGLLRDPFAGNNWKAKNIKLILRSKGAPTMPSLESSEALKQALELPVPQGELT